MSNLIRVTRVEIKNVLGGVPPAGESCSCVLIGDKSVEVDYPMPSSALESSEACSTACKAACDDAPLFNAHSAVFASTGVNPE